MADYLSAMSAGIWWRGDQDVPEYLAPMSEGLWRNASPQFTISGLTAGIGVIDSDTIFEITANVDGVTGFGYITHDATFEFLYTISGRVIGIGSISSDIDERAPVVISGTTVGIGSIGYRLNYSKRTTLNPLLIAENQTYNLGDCPIAAIEYEGFSPNKIIDLIPREDEIYENTLDYHRIETIKKEGSVYPIRHYPYHNTWNSKLKYLVTDYRSHDSNGEPLFFQYEPLFDVSAPNSGVAISNIYANDEIIINPKDYIIQYSYDLLSDGNSRYGSTTWGAQRRDSVAHRVRVLLPYKLVDGNQYFTIEYHKSNFNVDKYQKELIELVDLYDTSDYSLSSSGLSRSVGSRISDAGSLMIVKDPRFRVSALDIVSLKGEDAYLADKVATWRLRMNVGSFFQGSGFFSSNEANLYSLEDKYFDDTLVPVTNVIPTLVRPNLLRLRESPIHIDPAAYTYPLYIIDRYDKTQETLIDARGKIAIDVNGITRNDIKITSIDTQKGFIQLDTDLNPTDEIELTYFMSTSGNFLVENLELNPKIVGDDNQADFHISGYPDGFGIAVLPYSNDASGWYPYIYDLNTSPNASRIMYNIYRRDTPSDSISMPWTSGNFVTICEATLNRLSSEILTLTDARRVGGGPVVNRELRDWYRSNYSGIQEHEKDWYTDYGYYGGPALSNSSMVIVHVPDPLISGMRDQWISYYEQSISNPEEARDRGESEFKHYLDQAIRRHLSAGTDYILIPTISGVITNKFLDLRQ